MLREAIGRGSLLLCVLSASGCAARGAPSFSLFGAYFPAWMMCALIGIVAAVAARVLLALLRWFEVVPYPLTVCTSVGAIFGAGTWLVWFGS